MRRGLACGLLAAVLLAACALPARAGPDAIEVLTGYSTAQLEKGQGNYVTLPLRIGIYHDAEPVLERILGYEPGGDWDFIIEPFLDQTLEPEHKYEIGCALGLKLGTPLSDKLHAYVKASTGPMYTTMDTLEESTKFQFGSQGAVGLNYDLDDCSGLTLELRARHFSNASIKKPNSGVNSLYVLIGYWWNLD